MQKVEVFTGVAVPFRRSNVDTDQIIPAQFLNLIPTIPDEYEKLGAYALWGLPDSLYTTRFVKEGALDTEYPIVIAGRNFGCGSSREHAPIAMGSANCEVVVAESYARIFFRNCVATGEVYPVETESNLREYFKTGDVATVVKLFRVVLLLPLLVVSVQAQAQAMVAVQYAYLQASQGSLG